MFQSYMYNVFMKTGGDYTSQTIADRKVIEYTLADSFFKIVENCSFAKVAAVLKLEVLCDIPAMNIIMELKGSFHNAPDIPMIAVLTINTKTDFVKGVSDFTMEHGGLAKLNSLRIYLE